MTEPLTLWYQIVFHLCDFSRQSNPLDAVSAPFQAYTSFYLSVMNTHSPHHQAQYECLRGICTNFSPACLAF